MLRLLAPIVLCMMLAPRAFADDSPTKQAGAHFERGVALYGEADYRAALVEFRRAYEIAPNAAVLYNIGQTYYQLQNYAAALTTFERFLADAGDSPSHKAEVDEFIKTLKSRVGRIAVTVNLPDTEITVDDELAGKSPLSAAIDVSIGRRKVTALHAGRAPETRYVDVAAGETSKLDIQLAAPPDLTVKPTDSPGQPATGPEQDSTTLTTSMWIATGVLGVGAIGTGVFAYLASRDLQDARNTFPATQSDLDSKASKVTTLSAIADIAGAATLVVGGIAVYLTLSHSSSHEAHVAVVPGGITIAGSFK
jgi:hypothetical protein